ncbi:MAG TPA: hypothetical protein VJS67_09585 [Pseudonocardiaceae bacterium]|nr:hypothetical protein [Pseudonocardiaceae bacterium]
MSRVIRRGTLYLFGRFAWAQRRDAQANPPAMYLVGRLNRGIAGAPASLGKPLERLASTSSWLGGRFATLRAARLARELSASALAERSGVSRG